MWLKTACSNCNLRELCMPVGLTADELCQLDSLVDDRRHIERGASLYAAGSPFKAFHAVRVGSFKTSVLAEDGREQVTGFHMVGELIGLDGIGTDIHTCSASALEDSEVCLLPFSRLEDFSRTMPVLQHHMYRLMGAEIVRAQFSMMMLGTMRADEKLSLFLLNLSDRYLKRGYSASEFVLRMSRKEIGSYLGLEFETVSRLFSRFQNEGLIVVQQKYIKLLEPAILRNLIGTPD